MPLTYIDATVAGAKFVNAQQLAAQLGDVPDWLADINSVTCGSGPQPGFGKFLISQADYDSTWPTTGLFDIELTRSVDGSATTVTLKGYVTVEAQRALRATNSPMIVTVADARYIAMQSYSNREYNLDGGDEQEWPDVLGDFTDDVPTDVDSSGLVFSAMPTYPLGRWLIDGRSTLDALAELGARTGHLLTWNPIDGTLEYQPISGSQTDPTATVHRNYGVPTTDYAHDLSGVRVSHEKEGTAQSESEVIDIPGSGMPPGTMHAWGLLVLDIASPGDIEDESNALMQVWDDWSERQFAGGDDWGHHGLVADSLQPRR